MLHKLVTDAVAAGEDGHLQRVQGQASAQVVSDLPADDLRENRSATDAVQANLQAVSTYVMSATHRRFGAGAVKSRSSRSAGRWPPASDTVVRGF